LDETNRLIEVVDWWELSHILREKCLISTAHHIQFWSPWCTLTVQWVLYWKLFYSTRGRGNLCRIEQKI
jgi:hypothetical protein